MLVERGAWLVTVRDVFVEPAVGLAELRAVVDINPESVALVLLGYVYRIRISGQGSGEGIFLALGKELLLLLELLAGLHKLVVCLEGKDEDYSCKYHEEAYDIHGCGCRQGNEDSAADDKYE